MSTVSVNCSAVSTTIEVDVSVKVVVAAFGVIVLVVDAQTCTKAVNGRPIVLVDLGTFCTDETPSFVLHRPSARPALTVLAACKAVARKTTRMGAWIYCACWKTMRLFFRLYADQASIQVGFKLIEVIEVC